MRDNKTSTENIVLYIFGLVLVIWFALLIAPAFADGLADGRDIRSVFAASAEELLAYALELYCRENGLCHDEVVYVGDDYGPGGNDESVYMADFHFIEIDDYRSTPEKLQFLL